MLNQKNIIIACLTLLCVLLLVTWQTERTASQNRPISATEYGSLLALRQVLPPDQFKADVLPLLEKAASGKPVTFMELEALEARLGDISKHVLAAAEKKSPQEELTQAWEETKQNATEFGEQFSQEMNNMLKGLSNMLNQEDKPSQPDPAPAPSADSNAPIEL